MISYVDIWSLWNRQGQWNFSENHLKRHITIFDMRIDRSVRVLCGSEAGPAGQFVTANNWNLWFKQKLKIFGSRAETLEARPHGERLSLPAMLLIISVIIEIQVTNYRWAKRARGIISARIWKVCFLWRIWSQSWLRSAPNWYSWRLFQPTRFMSLSRNKHEEF